MTTPEALFTLFVALAAFALGAHWERRREWEWLERQRSEMKREQEAIKLSRLVLQSQPKTLSGRVTRDGELTELGDKN